MTTSQKITLAALALLLAGAGTYGFLRLHPGKEAGGSSVTTISAVESTVPSGRPRTAPIEVVPTNAADRLARLRSILATSSRLLRHRSLIGFLDRLSPAQVEEAAMCFGSGQIDPDQFPVEYSFIVAAWAHLDPAKTLAFGESRNDDAFGTAIRTWASRDPEAAMRWATSPPRDSNGSAAPQEVVLAVGIEDPKRALAMIDGHPEWRIYLDTGRIFSSWAAIDPAEASAALKQIPPGNGRNAAVRGIAERLTGKTGDPFELLDQYPEASTDSLVEHLVGTRMRIDPAASMSQIPRIANEQVRNQCYATGLKTWTAKDPAAARSWLESASLPPEVRQQLKESR